MKHTIAIFFLSLYLLAATEAHQFLKLPIVFQHFQEHKAENKDIGFFQFLQMHYFNGDPMDADYERDMQLPFKTSTDCVVSVIPVTIPAAISIVIPSAEFFINNDFVTVSDSPVPSAYLDAIFQPPRV